MPILSPDYQEGILLPAAGGFPGCANWWDEVCCIASRTTEYFPSCDTSRDATGQLAFLSVPKATAGPPQKLPELRLRALQVGKLA